MRNLTFGVKLRIYATVACVTKRMSARMKERCWDAEMKILSSGEKRIESGMNPSDEYIMYGRQIQGSWLRWFGHI